MDYTVLCYHAVATVLYTNLLVHMQLYGLHTHTVGGQAPEHCYAHVASTGAWSIECRISLHCPHEGTIWLEFDTWLRHQIYRVAWSMCNKKIPARTSPSCQSACETSFYSQNWMACNSTVEMPLMRYAHIHYTCWIWDGLMPIICTYMYNKCVMYMCIPHEGHFYSWIAWFEFHSVLAIEWRLECRLTWRWHTCWNLLHT